MPRRRTIGPGFDGEGHPGRLLRRQILPALKLTISQAAQDLGITRQSLHRILAGRAAITPEMALRFERLCGVSSRFWLERQHAYELLRAEAAMENALSQIPQHPLPENIMAELDVK
ncbi:HigA family addiction module antitoxin [Teichococcus aestuarii]|uniref:Addiction module antidote protein, HigA family n=1 Tax=Teichococcus aestuarii TaxID=568898 RepID=A0A2U1V547_9PROT|nr:HigA family addiction module antitoxin [Pseudoroseomonas aestuarii]PWC29040.1 addiction module antidote protein, HigA family [Pseudoroseomonas aestuarii]